METLNLSKVSSHINLVSVIIPAYNHALYIAEAINSIIEQTYSKIELIIVNDGSSDNTDYIIRKNLEAYKARFIRVEYINSQKNQGAVLTINKGLSLSRGEYVLFLASDDKLEPQAITVLHNFLANNKNYGLVVGDNYIIDKNSTRCYWDINCNNVYNLTEASFKTFREYFQYSRPDVDFNSNKFGNYLSLLKLNYIPNGYLIRIQDLYKSGGHLNTKKSSLEDHYMLLQLSKIAKFKYVNQPLLSYRWHSKNSIKQTNKIWFYTHNTIINEKDYAYIYGFKEQFKKYWHFKQKVFLSFLKIQKVTTLLHSGTITTLFIKILSITIAVSLRYKNKKYRIKRISLCFN